MSSSPPTGPDSDPYVYGSTGSSPTPSPPHGERLPRPASAGNVIATAALVFGLTAVVIRSAVWLVFGDFAGLLSATIVAAPALLAIALGVAGIVRTRRVRAGLPSAIIGLALGAVVALLAVSALLHVA